MFWFVALAVAILVPVGLLILFEDGRLLLGVLAKLFVSLLGLAWVSLGLALRFLRALPEIVPALGRALATIARARLDLARHRRTTKRMKATYRRAFSSFTPVAELPGECARNERLEMILEGIFRLEFPDLDVLVGKRSASARIMIVMDPDDETIRHGIVKIEPQKSSDVPLMETAALLDAVLADFAPECRVGLKLHLAAASGHDRMAHLEAIAGWLASQPQLAALRAKFGF